MVAPTLTKSHKKLFAKVLEGFGELLLRRFPEK
jgi:hypothetical protein